MSRNLGSLLVGVLALVGCASEPVAPAPSSGVARARLEAFRTRFPSAPLRAETTRSPFKANVTLPASADGEVDVEDAASGVAVRFRLEGAPAATREDVDGVSLYASAGVLQRAHDAGVEDYVAFDAKPQLEEARYSVDVSRAAGLRVVQNSLELLDSHGAPRLRVAAPFVIEQGGAKKPAQLTVEGCAYDSSAAAPWGRPVTAAGSDHCTVRVTWSNVSYPALLDPAWTTTGLASARDSHLAVKLTSGQVLMAYGFACGGNCFPQGSAYLYDPTTRTFANTGSTPDRYGSLGVALKNGKALIGLSSLLYDPGTGKFDDNTPITCNGCDTFTALPSGKVLISGGTALLYNPITNETEPTGAVVASRTGAVTALLKSGKVLVAGGTGLASAEIYDPAANTFTATAGEMTTTTPQRFAFTLASGKVLIFGGDDNTAQLFDPATEKFTATGTLLQARSKYAAALLDSGKVLVVGGFINKSATTSVERYEPASGAFVTGPSLTTARGNHRVTLLDDGSLLASFGRNIDNETSGQSLSTSELLTFSAPGSTCNTDDTCHSGICDNGVCCESSCTKACHACSAGTGACDVVKSADDPDSCTGANSCNADGDCKKKLGEACKAAAECGSGFCADGFCCDQACAGTCEACDGLVHGTCDAIAGLPHGARACTGGTSQCAGACDGKHVKACIYPGITTGCGTSCTDAERIASTCDGQGDCVEQPARPCPGNFTCADETTCKTSCATSDDCVSSYACIEGACTPTAACDGDHTIRSADGKSTTDCAPFKCNAKNRCKTACESVADCANPFVCDPTGTCVAAPPNTSTAGCSLARHDTNDAASLATLALVAALGFARRRRQNS